MTLQSELEDLGRLLAQNLTTKGVTSSYDEGLTTLANKILTVQSGSGSSCDWVGFDETTYVGEGGTATLYLEVQSNYEPVPNIPIILTGSDNSSQTATTNSNGIVSFTVTGTIGTTVNYSVSYNNATAICSVTFTEEALIKRIYNDKSNNVYVGGNSSQITFEDNSLIYTSVLETESTFELTNSTNWRLSFTAKGSTDNRQCWDIGYMSYGDGCLRIGRDVSNCFVEMRTTTSSSVKVYDFGTNFMSTTDKEVIVTSINKNITVSINNTSYNVGTYDIKPTLGATKWGGGTVTFKNISIESL